MDMQSNTANLRKYIDVPILIYFFLSLMLYWAHYPVGTYEMSGDLWKVGNYLASMFDLYDFSNDYWMSNKYLHKPYFNLLIIHIPFYKCFNHWESYISVLNSVLFFAGCSLLYLILHKISKSKFIAFFASLLFSSATVCFFTGDIFALVPIYATLQRTLCYIWYLGTLLLFLSFPLSMIRMIGLSIMITLMVWIHPTTWLGPGISSLIVIFIYYLWKTKENPKKKMCVASISIGLTLLLATPYIYSSKSWGETKVSINLTDEENSIFSQDFKSRRQKDINPMDFKLFKSDLNNIRGYRLMLVLAIVLSIASLLFIRKNRNIKFFAAFALTCFSFNFFIRELEYFFFRDDGITVFNSLVRNNKWVYFFCFFIIVASYPELRRFADKYKNKYSLIVLNGAFLTLIIVGLNAPYDLQLKMNFLFNRSYNKNNMIYSYGPLYRTMTNNYIGMKIVQKLGLCQIAGNGGINSAVSKFCPDDKTLGILKIDNDVRAATTFMFSLPDKQTFAGPNWLRYKAHRNMVFNVSDGYQYLVARDRKYFKWKESDRVYYNLINDWLYTKDPKEILEQARKINADFLFLEKFRHIFIDRELRYAFVKRNYDLSKLPVIYENDSFAIIDLRKREDEGATSLEQQRDVGPVKNSLVVNTTEMSR